MKKEKIRIHDVKESLRRRNFGGVPLGNNTSVAQVYATVASLDSNEKLPSSSTDWAVVSYVHSNSPTASGGMPVWVAEDAEQVLDGLLEANIISERAVWFDIIGMKQSTEWPALGTVHCLAAPVISVPPTRTLEYSRYQIPDRWDAATFDFFSKVEVLLRECSVCGSRCPAEFDSRLLNLAAALRAWPTNEATIGSSSRGAFVSFSTLDRLQYTISWYQVLLQMALDLGGYSADLLSKSVELYGKGLFQPCSRCCSTARVLAYEKSTNVDFQLLDDALVALVMQGNRFATPVASDDDGFELWSLEGLFKSPGEKFRLRQRNSERLLEFSRPFLLQSSLSEVAANICRGRPALSTAFNEGDKWLCALILSNLDNYIQAFAPQFASFEIGSREQLAHILKSSDAFGDLCFRDSTLEVEPNRCIRSPPCSASTDICLFNELSGVLHPSSVKQFLSSRSFPREQILEILQIRHRHLRSRIQAGGVAYLCHEYVTETAKPYIAGICTGCSSHSSSSDIQIEKHVLIAWKSKEAESTSHASQRGASAGEVVYSFMTISTGAASHVRSRGILTRDNSERCRKCGESFIRIEVENSECMIDVYADRMLPTTTVFRAVRDGWWATHRI